MSKISTGKRKNGEGSWSIQTRKNVQYHVFRVQYNGVRKTFYGRTVKEVKQKVAEYEKERSLKVVRDTKKLTFGEFIEEWYNEVYSMKLELTTKSNNKFLLKSHILECDYYNIANVQMADIDAKLFQGHINAMAERYSRATKTEKSLF